jgi:hypothetical protein
MLTSEVLDTLRERGIIVTEAQIRWLFKTRKVARPRLDRGLRFNFTPANVAEIERHFQGRVDTTAEASCF